MITGKIYFTATILLWYITLIVIYLEINCLKDGIQNSNKFNNYRIIRSNWK